MTPAPAPAYPRFTLEEFLDRNARSELKSEFLHGHMYAMAGATKAHNRIASRCLSRFNAQLLDGNCEAFGSDQMVLAPGAEAAFYPDLTVACGEQLEDGKLALDAPILVLEVLSPSTRAYDLTTKLLQYQRIPSLRHILFIDSESISVHHFSRGPGELWPTQPQLFSRRDEIVDLPALDATLELAEIYRKIDFPLPA